MSCAFGRVADHHTLLYDLPLFKTPVLDKLRWTSDSPRGLSTHVDGEQAHGLGECLGCGQNGVNTNGAAAKLIDFDRLVKNIFPGTFGNIKVD